MVLSAIPAAESQVLQRDSPGFYHTWETLTKDLQDLSKAHPGLTRLYSIGKGSLGLDLWMIEITNFNAASPPLEDRTHIYLDGGTHGNEQLGTEAAFEVVLMLLNEFEKNETVTWMVNNQHYFIVPMVNTDGNVLNSRTNAKQVNINRNFPVGWEREGATDTPGSNYRGPYPGSESETQAVMAAIDRVKPDYSNSFHTGTVMFLYPWGGFTVENPDNDTFAKMCEGINQPDVPCGPIYFTIYPAGGTTCDYAYWSVGANSWTFETSNEQGAYFTATGDVRGAIKETWDAMMWTLPKAHLLGGHLEILEKTIEGGVDAPVLKLVMKNDGLGKAGNASLSVQGSDASYSKSVLLGDFASGETREIRVPMPKANPGSTDIALKATYEKRAFRAPIGSIHAALQVVSDGTSLSLFSVDEAQPVEIPLSSLSGTPSRVPGFEGAYVIGALGVLAVVSRRRS
jgi:hypothetical protein